MKLQATKDGFGVQLWHDGVELVLKSSRIRLENADIDSNNATIETSKVWINKNFSLFRRCLFMDTKKVSKYFPELNSTMEIGEKKNIELVIK